MKKEQAFLLMAAAGQGSRMGGKENKIYLPLAGRPVLTHTLEVFLKLNIFSKVIVIIAPGETQTFRQRVLIPFFCQQEEILLLEGGGNRQQSVFNGLKYLHSISIPEDSLVCIHDAARPLVREELIRRVYQEACSFGAAVAALPLKDTIKEVDSNSKVVHTPPRETLRAVQTPQCFKFSIIWKAHCKAREENFQGSDDASLIERLGLEVRVVPGEEENIKITTPADLIIAEAFLNARRNAK